MIAVTPDNDAGRLLACVVAAPGQLDAEALGERLWRPALTSTADYPRVRKIIQEHDAGWSERASKLLHRLQQQGLMQGRQPPRVGPAYVAYTEIADKTQRNLLKILVRKQPESMKAWVGSAPVSTVQRAISTLVENRLITVPSQRWPTEKGIALVKSWEENKHHE